VIAAGERSRPLWERRGLWAVPVGRDVVVRRGEFEPHGRQFRNLRQAVQRSYNSGVTVEFRQERDVPAHVVAEIRALMRVSGQKDDRGFSMTRGHLFDGGAPDAVVAIARDRKGRFAGAHRYLWSGPKDLSLDLPIRSHYATNGVDERLVAETVAWGADRGVERISLSFAPFPELFADRTQFGRAGTVLYRVTHLLDPFIRVERLYKYLRKYHAFDQERYVLLRKRQVVVVAAVLLLLEFGRDRLHHRPRHPRLRRRSA
jgi:lysylphosphatidylglycerol synthetase-like protein (DUF2156 family)